MKLTKKIYQKLKYIKWRTNDKERISEIYGLSQIKSKKIYLFGTPEYVNYGDHLIALGEKKFLRDKFPSYDVIEITKEILILHFEKIAQYIEDTDIIAITGGGFWGELYSDMETLMDEILERFKKNTIIFFPATIYLSEESQKLNGEYKLFEKINNLTRGIFFAREMNTYTLLKNKCFNKNVEISLSPDIALYYKYNSNLKTGENIGVCIRKDKEAFVDFDKNYVNLLDEDSIEYFSTVKSSSFLSPKIRKTEIDDFLDRVASYDFVITDRLHCMIMCYITRRPCIAFDNLTRKISGVYTWIEKCNFIKLVTSLNEFRQALEEFSLHKCNINEGAELDNEFSKMEQQIKQIINYEVVIEELNNESR